MFQQWFDDLARAAAGGRSRRQALKQIGGVVGAAVVAALPGQVLADTGGNSACAHFCHQVYSGEAAGDCTSQAAHGQGLCYQCGPAAGNTGLILCGQTCVNAQADVHNCGACGNACMAPTNASPVCTNGHCDFVCDAGYTRCGNACVNEQTDLNHCGACGTVCMAPANATATCTGGACGFICNSGFKLCNGACIPTSACCTAADCPTPANGAATCTNGVCGVTCNTGYHLCGGACVSDTSVASCGSSCTPCPTPANATATCTGGACGITCDSGYQACNGACIPTSACCTSADCGAGKVCAHGGCFTVCNSGSCPTGCAGCYGSVQGTGDYVCGTIVSFNCPCPVGQACTDGTCLAPC